MTRLCCLAHCRRKFFEALPADRRKKLKLLDINSSEPIPEQPDNIETSEMLPVEKGLAFCNKLFFLERLYKDLSVKDRKTKRLEKEPEVWDSFWSWIDTFTG